ncbi:hypothetical protein ACFL3C_04015 [Patescibacteria group bacterium]
MRKQEPMPQAMPGMKWPKAETDRLLDEFFEGMHEGENGHWKDLLWLLGLPQKMGFNSLHDRQRRFVNAIHSRKGLTNGNTGERITNATLKVTMDRIKELYRERMRVPSRRPFSNDLYPYREQLLWVLEGKTQDPNAAVETEE